MALRAWTLDDMDCVAELSTDPRIPAGTTVPATFTPAAGREYIVRQWSRVDRGEGISMAIHAHDVDRAIGFIVMMLRPQPGVVGLGYGIVPSARGCGYASRAAIQRSGIAAVLRHLARTSGERITTAADPAVGDTSFVVGQR